MQATLEHTKTSWTQWMVIAGIVIACANMGLGWKIMAESRPSRLTKTTSDAATHAAPVSAAEALPLAVRLHEANVDAVWRAATYQHAVTTVGLAFSFGLLAVGFALFVMGIESAFSVKGEYQELGTLALKATSPGVLCFILAALLIAITLLRPHALSVPDLVLPAELLSGSGVEG